jgi:endonuclease III
MGRSRGSSDEKIVAALLDRYGTTYADEAGIDLGRGTPAPLWQLLVLSILLSARITASTAVTAAKAIKREGWTTARKLSESTWERRAEVLHEAGYTRYDERTATMLGDTAGLVLHDYGGDLRRLREAAGRDVAAERRLLKRFKGMGEVGADVFLREAQAVWDEARPFFDRRALDTAGRLGLPKDARRLARIVGDRDAPRLAAALIRAGLARDFDEIRGAAV